MTLLLLLLLLRPLLLPTGVHDASKVGSIETNLKGKHRRLVGRPGLFAHRQPLPNDLDRTAATQVETAAAAAED